jgi:hypothetical protein
MPTSPSSIPSTRPAAYPERPAQPAAVYALPTRESAPMTTEPETPYEAPKNPEPHRTHVRTTYCPPVGIDCLMDMLRMATKLRTYGEPFSFEAACVSYMLDQDKGTIRAKTDYDRQWGWSTQQRKTRWSDLLETVGNWTTFHGKKANRPATAEQPTANREQVDSESESQSSNRPATAEQPTANRHTNQTQTTDSEKNPPNPPRGKRERGDDFEMAIASLTIPPVLQAQSGFLEWWPQWIESRRHSHKRPQSWQRLFQNQLKVLASYTPEQTLHVLRKSASNGYQGLVDPPAPIRNGMPANRGGGV